MKITTTLVSLTISLSLLSACANKKKDEEATPAPTSAAQEQKKTEPSKAKAPSPEALTCTSGKDSRSLEVVTVGSGCELKYSKFGNTETVASSGSSVEHCKTIAERIRGKLESAGFQCK